MIKIKNRLDFSNLFKKCWISEKCFSTPTITYDSCEADFIEQSKNEKFKDLEDKFE